MFRLMRLPKTQFRRTTASVVPTGRKSEEVQLKNEVVLTYEPKSKERAELRAALDNLSSRCEEIPIVIGGKEMMSDKVCYQPLPHRHAKKIAKFYHADKKCIEKAIAAAVEAQPKWDNVPLQERIDIWERAAQLMSTKYRAELVAATMLGQAKTVVQAEYDAAAELIDFIRMNAAYLKLDMQYEPINENIHVTRNSIRFRGFDGFVAAISPFNFTAIGGNLAYTPALMGNAVLWKPSDSSVLANWITFRIMCEAGVPPGVVNFVPSDGPTYGDVITDSPNLAGINFTGSMITFKRLWRQVAKNIDIFHNYPRLIGECGGKNFHFVHKTADVDTVISGTIRSAFEYSGQKCSACSRLYVPASLWESQIMEPLVAKTEDLLVGDVCNFKSFLSAVIDDRAFKRVVDYIVEAKTSKVCKIIAGGTFANLKGFFVRPTIVVVQTPAHPLLTDEIFGPILAVYVYKDEELDQAMDLVVNTTKYSLTGAVFAQDEDFLKKAMQKFKMAAGNFYINDKSTGSVVGQQPFGGGHMSGTNDKAGGPHYILRWTTQQSIKETFVPQTEIYYPYMSKPDE